MWAAVVAGLLGASLAAAAGSMTWLTARISIIEGVAPVTVRLSGGAVQPGSAVLAAAALAAGAGVVATRRWGRLFPGLALLAVGLWVAVGAVSVLADPHGTAAESETVRQAGTSHLVILAVDAGAAPALAAAGGVLMAVAGLLVLVRGWRWGALGERYQLPATGFLRRERLSRGQLRRGRCERVSRPAARAGPKRRRARNAWGPVQPGQGGRHRSRRRRLAGGERTRKARSGVGARGPAGVDTDAWRAIEEGEDPTQEP